MSSRKRPSLSRPRTSIFTSRPWTSYSTAKPRPRISGPMDFRRVSDPSNFARRGGRFRPLELSIYLPDGRLSPLPDFDAFDWDNGTADLAMPKPAMVRDSIIEAQDLGLSTEPQNISNSGSGTELSVEDGPGPVLHHEDYSPALPGLSFEAMNRPPYQKEDYLITLPKQPTPNLQRPHTARSPSGRRTPEQSRGHGRSLSDLVRPLKSSTGSIRRSKPDPVDDAIRELNTIVEERRVSALRKSQSGNEQIPNHHVPAIAPSMKVRVRSETLSDIGSAFSMPLSSNPPLPSGPPAAVQSPQSFVNPLASPPAATVKSSRSSRLRTWFTWSTSSRSSTDSIISTDTPSEPFYQCAPAEANIGTSKAYPYGHVSSPSASTFTSSVASYTDSTTSPTTAVTGVTTPLTFSPVDGVVGSPELRHHSSLKSYASSAASRPRPSTSSASRSGSGAGGRRLPPLPRKRGISVDTTSTVDSSILDEGTATATTNGNTAFVNLNKAPATVAYRELNPLRGNPVGVAY
jgi:hypothetical protein